MKKIILALGLLFILSSAFMKVALADSTSKTVCFTNSQPYDIKVVLMGKEKDLKANQSKKFNHVPTAKGTMAQISVKNNEGIYQVIENQLDVGNEKIFMYTIQNIAENCVDGSLKNTNKCKVIILQSGAEC